MRLVEFLTIYLIAPAAMALFLPPGILFRVLAGVSAVGIILLHFTPGFRWRSLLSGRAALRLKTIAPTAAISALVGLIIIGGWNPKALFFILRERPELMLLISVFYPILSVLPQEIIYRPLYFRRYGHLLPKGRSGLTLNAAIFSFGHLMYWSWLVAILTFFGGLIFAWAYETKNSFPLAIVLHSVTGIIFFAIGMGIYFYSGNVVRPF